VRLETGGKRPAPKRSEGDAPALTPDQAGDPVKLRWYGAFPEVQSKEERVRPDLRQRHPDHFLIGQVVGCVELKGGSLARTGISLDPTRRTGSISHGRFSSCEHRSITSCLRTGGRVPRDARPTTGRSPFLPRGRPWTHGAGHAGKLSHPWMRCQAGLWKTACSPSSFNSKVSPASFAKESVAILQPGAYSTPYSSTTSIPPGTTCGQK